MTAGELKSILNAGETSRVQFKERMPHGDSLAREIVAMSNSSGGTILFGIEDVTARPVGLSKSQIEEYDRTISQVADNIKPIVYVTTEVVNLGTETNPENVLVIGVPEGVNKPYKTDKGEIFLKQGANKRLVTDNGEIMRLFQRSGNLLADEMCVYGTTSDDIDEKAFFRYFRREFGMTYEEKGLTFEEALRAKRVLRNGELTLAGLLFFGKSPQSVKPAFTIKVVSFLGNDPAGSSYRTKPTDLEGTVPELFEKCMGWLKNCLQSLQDGQGFNSIGRLEINEEALVELVQNALVHRDYFKNAPIRVMLFDNRLEIISPGRLPNSLTVEDIRYGNPVVRNNQMVAFASLTMPFSGLGTGIRRALERQPNIELENDVESDQFKVVIPRGIQVAPSV